MQSVAEFEIEKPLVVSLAVTAVVLLVWTTVVCKESVEPGISEWQYNYTCMKHTAIYQVQA